MSLIVRYYMLSAAFNICLGPLFVLIFLFFSVFSSLSLLCRMACGILVLQQWGSGLKLWDRRPDPWWENFQPHGIHWQEVSKRPGLNHKTWPDTKASKLQCWTLHAKQLENRNRTLPISRQSAQSHTKFTDISKYTTGCIALPLGGKIHLQPP